MSNLHAPPLRDMNLQAPSQLPPRQLSKQRTWSPETILRETAPSLRKQRSWSPDVHREEAWRRRRQENRRGCSGLRHGNAVTNGDLEELKACIELGFGFDSPEIDPKLAETLPALGLYLAGSASSVIDTGDDPETVKTRLKQWAQIVACSVRQCSGTV